MENTSDLLRPSRRTALIGGISAVALLGATPAAFAAQKLNVVATIGMIADAARRVGGELVEVRSLMGSGVDPHSYRQTRSDIVALTRADLVLWHGLYLEAQMERFFEDLGRKRAVVAVADALPKDDLLSHPDYEGRYDPHVWMDPNTWFAVVDEVTRALTEAQPAGAETFAQNAATYRAELEHLASYAAETVAQVPESQRVLVTAHDAFSYFGRAFGFEVIGIQGISTNSEAGLNRISALVDELVDREIGAVFVETSVSDRNMRALVEGAAARGHEVVIGGSLYSDAMGEPGSYEGTYIGMIDHNVTTIARALGASVDAGGMNGKLVQGS
ncbi:metal ABC transporter solute-binding protein, Zn/Mn family [Sulfitobacter dubius]|uniref:metal ABC transporter solute-binding protein, Zn/Mn family n=1 Tax=Sulfitobacter dubius TaxID=218673 RepID=UPI0008EEDC06|nr:zinc ABC transporter substrate-binding protein [Sulfitobacter dubius]SFH00891.1 manganese/zinc/iron transport system substrate-binding protein [Sulfitobacter dubius]